MSSLNRTATCGAARVRMRPGRGELFDSSYQHPFPQLIHVQIFHDDVYVTTLVHSSCCLLVQGDSLIRGYIKPNKSILFKRILFLICYVFFSKLFLLDYLQKVKNSIMT